VIADITLALFAVSAVAIGGFMLIFGV